MIRIEPLFENFLETKPEKIVCKLPPTDFSYIELHKMKYFKRGKIISSDLFPMKFQLVAKGTFYYHDMIGSTEIIEFYIYKTLTKKFYHAARKDEIENYLKKEEHEFKGSIAIMS